MKSPQNSRLSKPRYFEISIYISWQCYLKSPLKSPRGKAAILFLYFPNFHEFSYTNSLNLLEIAR